MSAIEDKITDFLLKQYELQRHEVLVLVPLFRTHVRNFQIMAGAIFGATAFFLSRPELRPTAGNWLIWCIFVTLVPIIATYLFLESLGVKYLGNLLTEGMSRIEVELNKRLGAQIFMWEHCVANRFNRERRPLTGVINPDWCVGAFGVGIYVIMAIIIPGFAYYFIWTSRDMEGNCTARWVIIAGGLVLVFCALVAIFVGQRLLRMPEAIKEEMDRIFTFTHTADKRTPPMASQQP